MERLNGWQRLWVVIAGLGLLLTIVELVPSESNIKKYYHVAKAIEEPKCKNFLDPKSFKTRLSIIENKVYMSFDDGHKLLSPWYKNKCRDIASFVYENKIAIINRRDFYIFLLKSGLEKSMLPLFLWFVFSCGLYFTGMVVAWVIRGFKGK
jgi:hypothetical protein